MYIEMLESDEERLLTRAMEIRSFSKTIIEQYTSKRKGGHIVLEMNLVEQSTTPDT